MRKSNSVKQIVDFLNLTVCASENTIMEQVFGYYRNSTWESNKKYADMLRRGLSKGLYRRFESNFPGVRSRVFYYAGTIDEFEGLIDNHSEFFDFVVTNEGKYRSN